MATKTEIKFYTPEEFRKYIDIVKNTALEKEQNEKSLYEWNYYVFFNLHILSLWLTYVLKLDYQETS